MLALSLLLPGVTAFLYDLKFLRNVFNEISFCSWQTKSQKHSISVDEYPRKRCHLNFRRVILFLFLWMHWRSVGGGNLWYRSCIFQDGLDGHLSSKMFFSLTLACMVRSKQKSWQFSVHLNPIQIWLKCTWGRYFKAGSVPRREMRAFKK